MEVIRKQTGFGCLLLGENALLLNPSSFVSENVTNPVKKTTNPPFHARHEPLGRVRPSPSALAEWPLVVAEILGDLGRLRLGKVPRDLHHRRKLDRAEHRGGNQLVVNDDGQLLVEQIRHPVIELGLAGGL